MTDKAINGSLQVVAIGEKEGGAWQEYVSGHPLATSYHCLAWRTIFEESFGYRSWYLMARETVEGRVVGCLPLFLVSSPLSRRLVAVPFRDRGGMLWSTPEAFKALIDEARRIFARTRAGLLEIKTIEPYPADLVGTERLQENVHWVHSQVDLKNTDAAGYWSKIGAKTRNMIRQAEQAGLRFVDATNLQDGLSAWYDIHLTTQKHLGLPPFPRKFFRHLLQELGKTDGVRLFVVKRDQRPIAATILLLFRQTAIYGYSGSDVSSQELRPNDFMLFNTIKWLRERDFSVFDMGSDAPGQKGLLFFKRKWLAQQSKVAVYTSGRADAPLIDSSDPRYALFRRIFRRLPTGLLRLSGSMVTRYFG